MCDTLCVLGGGAALFAKNSDRPVGEDQVVAAHPRRRAGGTVRTQYLELPDTGAHATVLSRPTWLWGAEHGVNEHGVAVGNEMVLTVDDPGPAPAALIGMDLVRLGLERGADARGAVDVITALLERHGQGGVADAVHGLAYWSSFLVCDPLEAWVLETSGRRWAARPLAGGGAISNRLILRDDWTLAARDVAPGTDIDSWRDPSSSTAFADGRLAAGRAFVAGRPAGARRCDPRPAVAHLRDHGTGPWGAPGGDGEVVPAPADTGVDGAGITVCMHVADVEVTAASMVAELRVGGGGRGRAWAALGSPCASVYVPLLLPGTSGRGRHPEPAAVPGALGDAGVARRFAALGRAAARTPGALGRIRSVLGPLEAALWDEAEGIGADAARWAAFAEGVGASLASALDALDDLAAADVPPGPDGAPGPTGPSR